MIVWCQTCRSFLNVRWCAHILSTPSKPLVHVRIIHYCGSEWKDGTLFLGDCYSQLSITNGRQSLLLFKRIIQWACVYLAVWTTYAKYRENMHQITIQEFDLPFDQEITIQKISGNDKFSRLNINHSSKLYSWSELNTSSIHLERLLHWLKWLNLHQRPRV